MVDEASGLGEEWGHLRRVARGSAPVSGQPWWTGSFVRWRTPTLAPGWTVTSRALMLASTQHDGGRDSGPWWTPVSPGGTSSPTPRRMCRVEGARQAGTQQAVDERAVFHHRRTSAPSGNGAPGHDPHRLRGCRRPRKGSAPAATSPTTVSSARNPGEIGGPNGIARGPADTANGGASYRRNDAAGRAPRPRGARRHQLSPAPAAGRPRGGHLGILHRSRANLHFRSRNSVDTQPVP